MAGLTDFKAGLQNASDYLDGRHHLGGTFAQGTDALRIVGTAEYSFTLRELLCSILAGNGFKLPNLQICLHANINELLGIPNLQAELAGILGQLQAGLESFMDHTKIDDVLGRLNSVLGEAQQVANLINFCAVPVDPIAIPNLLERAFGSFLGAGKSIIDAIGNIAPGEVCACIGPGGFNTNAFQGGILGQIANNIEAINLGNLGQGIIDDIRNQVNQVTDSIKNLISFENNIGGAFSQGGSQFGGNPGCNTEVGVMHNPNSSVASNARYTTTLKSMYDNLAGYPVQYQYNRDPATGGPLITGGGGSGGGGSGGGGAGGLGEVIDYPNIFHLLLDDAMLELLDNDDDPVSNISNQQPVYDYCGNIIGYTANYVQRPVQQSAGAVPSAPTLGDGTVYPGYQAGGLTTDTSSVAEGATTIGTTTTATSSDSNVKYAKLQTTNATVETVRFSNVIQQPGDGKTWFFTIDALGGSTGGSSTRCGYKVEGVVQNISGTKFIVGSNVTTLFGSTSAGWLVDAVVDSNVFRIRVSGAANTTVNWSVKLSIVEL
jgi:hypothetical protein